MKLNIEDLQLFRKWFSDIILLHSNTRYIDSSHTITVEQHKMFQGMEVDFYLHVKYHDPNAKLYPNVKLWNPSWNPDQNLGVGETREFTSVIELKEADIQHALFQAIARRPLADFAYVVDNSSTWAILDTIKPNVEFLKYGVGLISGADDAIIFKSRRLTKEGILHKFSGYANENFIPLITFQPKEEETKP